MARYEGLTTLQGRTIKYLIEKSGMVFDSVENIHSNAEKLVKKIMTDFPDDFPPETEKRVYAFMLSGCGLQGVKDGTLSVADYISMLASAKEENENMLDDFGAFGDLYEILIRCALLKVKSFIRESALHVKSQNTVDIVSSKYGKLEIGHNGKTLSNGVLYDYMAGEYTGMVYGVFEEEDKKEVYRLCRNGDFLRAVRMVAENSVMWLDKYDFQNDVDSLTRGKGIAKKGNDIQVVFNPGKYNAFIDAIESGKFTSLWDTLHE